MNVKKAGLIYLVRRNNSNGDAFALRKANLPFTQPHRNMFQKATLLFLPAFLLSFFALSFSASAQSQRASNPAQVQRGSSEFTLTWIDTAVNKQLNDFKSYKTLSFEGAVYDVSNYGNLPLAAIRFPVKEYGDATVSLVNAKYETLPDALQDVVDASKIPHQVVLSSTVSTERFKHFANVVLVPLRVNASNGKVEKLVSFDLTSNVSPISKKGTRQDYAENSVLANGSWYKFGVQQDGIYRIDKAYLLALGINVSNIDPHNIRIYGNGGGMLPELNSVERHDDLVENAIYVSGESDGHFNDDDFILFYGQGPHTWKYDSVGQRFAHQQNLYSDYTYYFLTTDLGTGKRVETQAQSSNPSTATITSFTDHLFHESETSNLIKTGREWYGEPFQFLTDQTFSFNIPNPDASQPSELKVEFVSRSVGASRVVSVTANGTSAGSATISGTSGEYTAVYGYAGNVVKDLNLNSSSLAVGVSYNNPAGDGMGWLNYIEVNAKRLLKMNGNQMAFRSPAAINQIAEYKLSNATSSTIIWDITNPLEPKLQQYDLVGSDAVFKSESTSLTEYIAFQSGTSMMQPQAGTAVENQNLHSTGQVDYVIVTNPSLLTPAQALADFHASDNGFTTKVVTTEALYNEFSSGAQDITAIRDYMRMLYSRAATNGYEAPKYLMMFGDGSYDYKNKTADNSNLVPTFESYNSLYPTASFCTDDYFAMLDDNEGNVLSTGGVDLGVGRLPVDDAEEAYAMVNKIKVYASTANQGSWQNVFTMAADDEDGNTHLDDADGVAEYIATNYPVWNVDKIYLDAYKQLITPAGQRAPEVNTAIRNRIYNGTLIFNYAGHGGVSGLSHERILQVTDFDSWNNCNRMPLFVTATCEFSRFDDPDYRSAGELLLLKADGGAIGLVTTLRLVYASANEVLNSKFTYEIVRPNGDYYLPIGDALRIGKNNAIVLTDYANTRKFILLGDPGLTLDYPHHNVVTTEVNDQPWTPGTDTLKALEKVTIKGKINDASGALMSSFNGRVYPTVYDKTQTIQTLGDNNTQKKTFKLQKSIIYRGKATVTNGEFSYTFVVPKDINYQVDYGKISYFAEDGTTDAHGYSEINVGSVADNVIPDNEGPQVQLYMNDEKFAFGGMTDENPTVLLKLKDENGINTTGNGIGHDISGELDGNKQAAFIMNDFYEATENDYTSGKVSYPLKDLVEGRHTLDVKAWDVYNNSSSATTEFVVATSAKMALAHVLNYPNPFTTRTEFMFEHNMPGAALDVKVEIFTVSGKLVKTIQTNIFSNSAVHSDGFCRADEAGTGGYRVDGITWDGTDDFGDPIGRGVYVYRVSVRSDSGMSADKFEKLVVLK